MFVYISEPSKSIFITELRTGSTSLHTLANFGVLKKFIGHERNNMHPENTLDHDDMLSLCDTIKTDFHDYTVYMCIRDPLIRRESALTLITNQYIEQATYSECISFLRGIVSETIKNTGISKYGFVNYTLNDNHMDWGTSSYYHVFVINGIIPKLLHVKNKNLFRIPGFMHPGGCEQIQSDESDYHKVILNIIMEHHNDNQEAKNLWEEKDRQINNDASNNQAMDYAGRWNVNPVTVYKSATYQYYSNLFTVYDQQYRCNLVSNGVSHGHLGNPNTHFLPFQSWIDMETRLYHWAVALEEKNNRDATLKTSQWLLDKTLKTYAEYYDFPAIEEAYPDQITIYPGRKFLRLFSQDHLESFLTNT